MRLESLAVISILALSHAAIAAPPGPPEWSPAFSGAGITYSIFDDGPTCLLSFTTADGPRLFVGGEFSAVSNPGPTGTPPATLPAQGIAIWDGARWSALPAPLPSTVGAGTLQAITTYPIAGVPRVILAGFFQAPGTTAGIGYLDDARALRPLAPSSIAYAWFGGAYGWTPPSPPPPALPLAPEIIVTSGIFPQGTEYAYRYTPTSVLTLPPGVITVTNAFAEFDDGTGRAVYIGVPMSGAPSGGKLTKWTGTTLSSINPGPISWVNAMCVHDDGGGPALYIAGQAGIRRLRNGVWEAVTGTGAPAFNINALASFDDGSGAALYVAGQFTTNVPTPSGTTPAVNIARWRSGVWEALDSGLTGGVPKAMTVFDEDGPGPRPPGLFVVGKFTAAGGRPSLAIARWGSPICRADHNASNTLEIADIFDFINDWFSGNTRADFNGGGLAVPDIFDFLNAWFTGC